MNFFRKNYEYMVIFLGAIIGLLWILFIPTVPFSDFEYYHRLASEIANGGKWGDTYTSVGYSIILGVFYKIFGTDILVAKIINLVFTILNNLLVLKILRKTKLSDRSIKVVLTLFVLFPSNIYYNSLIATEVVFTSILLTIILLYLSNITAKYYFIGLLIGVDSLIKPFFPAMIFVILLVELIITRNLIKSLRVGLVLFIACLAIIAPWLYRNSTLVGEFTYISNNGGIVLYINNNSQNKTGSWMPATQIENSIVNTIDYQNSNATERNRMLVNASLNWITKNPVDFVSLGLHRLFNTYLRQWGVGDDIYYSFYGTNLSNGQTTVLAILKDIIRFTVFLVGIITLIIYSLKIASRIFNKKSVDACNVLLILTFYMFSLVYFITEGQSRYSYPLNFIAIYFAYLGLQTFELKIFREKFLPYH